MSNEKLNQSFEIPLEKIEDNIGANINGNFSGYDIVVSPRCIEYVEGISIFKTEVFEKLIRKITLKADSEEKIYPYANSEIRTFCREPKGFEIGQTFILSKKILSIMSNLEGRVFSGFESKGISKMPPVQIYGINREGRKVIAFYIPPIIEIQGKDAVLLDGIHRSYICKSAGTTINAVHINGVSSPLPFKIMGWRDASVVDEKPPIELRYKDLKREYFRDLSSIGVDG